MASQRENNNKATAENRVARRTITIKSGPKNKLIVESFFQFLLYYNIFPSFDFLFLLLLLSASSIEKEIFSGVRTRDQIDPFTQFSLFLSMWRPRRGKKGNKRRAPAML